MEVKVGIISGRRVALNRDGLEPGRLVDAVLTDVHDVQTAELCQAGDEHNPANGCRAVVVSAGSACKIIVAVDDGVAPVMGVGGRRLYATNADGDEVMAEVRLHPDGTIEIFNGAVAQTLYPDGRAITENDNASFTMNADGSFSFHGTAAAFDCPVTAPTVHGTTDLKFGATGKSVAGHKHADPQGGQTGVPV